MNPFNQPLRGIRVLDFSRLIAGPMATMILSDLGAEVIKVEPPSGDEGRRYGTQLVAGNSPMFLNYNRNKRSIVLDMKREKGLRLALELVARSDVLIENFRPGVIQRLGLGYDAVRTLNPRIVFCSISGFGQTGPYAQYPAFEAVVQAAGGSMSITGEEGGKPMRIGPSVGDFTAGVFAALSILGALYARQNDGQSRYLDVSLLEGQLALMNSFLVDYMITGKIPVSWGTTSQLQSPSGVFPTGTVDLMIMVGEAAWPAFCAALGVEHLMAEPRFATNPLRIGNRKDLEEAIVPALRRKPAEEWLAIFRARGIPCSPINDIAAVVGDPQVAARRAIGEVSHAGYGSLRLVGPVGWRLWPAEDDPPMQAPPLLGEHSGEVLHDILGLGSSEIAALEDEGIISKVETE